MYLKPRIALITAAQQQHILSLTATQIVSDISRGLLLSADVVCVYSWRALQVGRLSNSNAEEFYTQAHRQAQSEDVRRSEERAATGTAVGLLLPSSRLLEGLPLSVKDQFQQMGAMSTCGMASRVCYSYERDGLLLQLVRSAGALPFVRSSTPQLLMFSETDNAIWGLCCSAWDSARSPGGSSGGEAALLSANASVLGLGSDIGGSVRIPAHHSGKEKHKCCSCYCCCC